MSNPGSRNFPEFYKWNNCSECHINSQNPLETSKEQKSAWLFSAFWLFPGKDFQSLQCCERSERKQGDQHQQMRKLSQRSRRGKLHRAHSFQINNLAANFWTNYNLYVAPSVKAVNTELLSFHTGLLAGRFGIVPGVHPANIGCHKLVFFGWNHWVISWENAGDYF